MPKTVMYAGQKVALLTQHGKERVIAPVLESVLGCVIEHVTGFDTDLFGTFTRETPRLDTQIEAARRKARKGLQLSGLPVGMASEGSFGPDPFAGLFAWNVELMVWIDDNIGVELVGMAQGAARSGHFQTRDWGEVEAFAVRENFPRHQLVLRPQSQEDLHMYKDKGISDWDQLKSCFDECITQSSNGQVFIETELRAFANPGRMQHVEQAAGDLLQRIQSCCPACKTPGYWMTERRPGLPCSACGLPTSIYRSEVWTCMHCLYKSVKARTDCAVAEPRHCSYCNP